MLSGISSSLTPATLIIIILKSMIMVKSQGYPKVEICFVFSILSSEEAAVNRLSFIMEVS